MCQENFLHGTFVTTQLRHVQAVISNQNIDIIAEQLDDIVFDPPNIWSYLEVDGQLGSPGHRNEFRDEVVCKCMQRDYPQGEFCSACNATELVSDAVDTAGNLGGMGEKQFAALSKRDRRCRTIKQLRSQPVLKGLNAAAKCRLRYVSHLAADEKFPSFASVMKSSNHFSSTTFS